MMFHLGKMETGNWNFMLLMIHLTSSRIVLLSTDFDMNQAEIVDVSHCVGTSCSVAPSTQLKYMHFGEVDSGVDMRGEVSLWLGVQYIHGRLF